MHTTHQTQVQFTCNKNHPKPTPTPICTYKSNCRNILKKNTLLGPALVVVVDGWASCMWCKHSAGQLAGTWGSAAIVVSSVSVGINELSY